MTTELTTDQYKDTFDTKMVDVTKSAEPTVDIWSYVRQLTREKIVLDYVFDKELVKKYIETKPILLTMYCCRPTIKIFS